ncbi:MAG: site-specific DNA-methyltransferase [Gemmatimonadetes bacterium]|nr:site-specific DNA-methyltransferase [Gemmatimonadota bacterium]
MVNRSRQQVLKPIHPFPARMAPDLVLEWLRAIGDNRRVLDPMAGSGVVLRQAIELGHEAVGFDLDPLAVLMARVWTTPVTEENLDGWAARVVSEARGTSESDVQLDWMDDDEETRSFTEYWFAASQRADLRRIAFVLNRIGQGDCGEDKASLDAIRLALSRIIVTKEPRASLARDTSHSRPHRVLTDSDFQVFTAFEQSIRFLRRRLTGHPPSGAAHVAWGDARRLEALDDGMIDAVITSPPYLNAIDYLRGHRLALVWLGHGLRELRHIRSSSIGAERAPDDRTAAAMFSRIRQAMGNLEQLPNRYRLMIARYAEDIHLMISEIARVLRPGGTATLVVGNSCLRGTFIRNAAGVAEAARMVGLTPTGVRERVLPDNRRYLPVTEKGQLGRRMRTETVCSFVR